MTDAKAAFQQKPPQQPTFSLDVVLLGLGVLVIVASFFPIGNLAAQSLWTKENSAAYDKVTQQYKRSTYQSADRTGLSEEEWQAQRVRMKQQIDAMNVRLKRARNQPKLWSQYLLWAGALLVAGGAVWHRYQTA